MEPSGSRPLWSLLGPRLDMNTHTHTHTRRPCYDSHLHGGGVALDHLARMRAAVVDAEDAVVVFADQDFGEGAAGPALVDERPVEGQELGVVDLGRGRLFRRGQRKGMTGWAAVVERTTRG